MKYRKCHYFEGVTTMKKAIISNIHCEGCAKDIKNVLEHIYGISNVQVSFEGGYASFEGFVSNKVISQALLEEGYHLEKIVKM